MRVFVFLVLLLLLALFSEAVFTTVPLVLVVLIFLLAFYQSPRLLLIAFVMGIFLDNMTLSPYGERSSFFIVYVSILLLYERKFEITTLPFVMIATFVGAFCYLVFFNNGMVLLQAGVAGILGGVLFSIAKRLYNKPHERYSF